MSHYVDALEKIYCTNCGVSSTTETCKRCMEMTQCLSCKRRLPSYCYFAGSGSLCEVRRVANITVFIDVVVAAVAADVVVFYECVCCNTFVQHVCTSSMILYTLIQSSYYTLQSCTRKRYRPHIRSALGGVVTEIEFPVTRTDVLLELFVHRNRHEIQQSVGEYWRQHGYCLLVRFGVYGQLGDRLRLLS